jgi:hypothetical protein
LSGSITIAGSVEKSELVADKIVVTGKVGSSRVIGREVHIDTITRSQVVAEICSLRHTIDPSSTEICLLLYANLARMLDFLPEHLKVLQEEYSSIGEKIELADKRIASS